MCVVGGGGGGRQISSRQSSVFGSFLGEIQEGRDPTELCAWRRGGRHLLVVQTTFSLSFTQSFPGEGGNGAGSLSSSD